MPNRQLHLLALVFASFLFTLPVVAQSPYVHRVALSALPGQGLGLTFVQIDGNPYLVLASYEARAENNRWIYRVSTNLATRDLGFGLPREADGVGWEAQGAGVAATNLDSNPRPELVLMAYDNPEGDNTFRYRIGWNMDFTGRVERWSDAITAPGVGYEAQGAGIDIDQIDDDPRPDMVVGAYDSTPEDDDFFYRIGFNLGPDGVASSWSDRKQAPGLGWEADGMDLDVVRDNSGKPHLLLMVYDDAASVNEFRYRFGWDLNASGNVTGWSRPSRLLGLGDVGEGAGLAVFDRPAQGNLSRYSAVVAALDPNPGGKYREARLYQWQLEGDEGGPESVLAFRDFLPTCSGSTLNDHSFIEKETLGVSYSDGLGSFIGSYAAKKPTTVWTFLIPIPIYHGSNWYPVDRHRHTLCGKLRRYSFYLPTEEGVVDAGLYYPGDMDEADFNHYITPSDTFAFIGIDRDDVVGEVTPSWAFATNPWFPMEASAESSARDSQDLCIHGPWVTEEAHDDKPEIHPSEAYWWREGDDRWTMLLLRDGSRRFSRPGYFEDSAAEDSSWQPWARRPLWGTFRVPFSTPLDGDGIYNLSFYPELEPALTGGVVTATLDAGQDATGDAAHALKVDGQPVVSVHEIQVQDVKDWDLGVNFSGLCLAEGRTQLRGYLDLTLGILEDEEGAGRAVLRLSRHKAAEAPAPGTTPPPSGFVPAPPPTEMDLPGARSSGLSIDQGPLRLALVRGSLRREEMEDRRGVAGDFLIAGAEAADVKRAILITEGGRQPLELSEAGTVVKNAPVIRSVPASAARIEAELAEGTTRIVELPGLHINPAMTSQRFDRYEARERKLPFGERLGLASSALPPELWLTPLRSVELGLQPLYVPERNGKAASEDGSGIGAELTRALVQDSDRRKEVFGADDPISASWTVTIEDLQTGSRKIVLAAEAREHGVALDLPATLGKGRVAASFAPDVPPMRVTLEARLTDTLGHESAYRQDLWSHLVEGPADLEELARASLMLVQPKAGDEVIREAMNPSRTIPLDPRRDSLRPVRILGTYVRHAVADGALDPGEIERLVKIASPAPAEPSGQ